MIKIIFLFVLGVFIVGHATQHLSLNIISYEAFIQEDPKILRVLRKALHENGIVGIRGVPGYKEKVLKYINTIREFSALPESIKESYTPAANEMFLGYERGKEKFQRPNGKWVVDDLKISYYGLVPKNSLNKWPSEVDLCGPFQDLGGMMSQVGEAVMEKMGIIGAESGIYIDGVPRVGRMLYYCKSDDTSPNNPFWCGAHHDHGLFTVLIPASYFVDGEWIPEPEEAGLFVKTKEDFQKVCANDLDVMMFQVGEFAQLITNDALRATEHRVHKGKGPIERYTMALFFDAPMETVIHSHSILTKDSRYGGVPGKPCSYRQWREKTFKRYIIRN